MNGEMINTQAIACFKKPFLNQRTSLPFLWSSINPYKLWGCLSPLGLLVVSDHRHGIHLREGKDHGGIHLARGRKTNHRVEISSKIGKKNIFYPSHKSQHLHIIEKHSSKGHHQQELLFFVTYLCYIWKFNTSILLDIPNPKKFARRHPTQHTSRQCATIRARNRPPSLTRGKKNRIKLWRNLSLQDLNPGSRLATMVKELMVFLLDDDTNLYRTGGTRLDFQGQLIESWNFWTGKIPACLSISGEFPLNKRMPMFTTSQIQSIFWSLDGAVVAGWQASALMTLETTDQQQPFKGAGHVHVQVVPCQSL